MAYRWRLADEQDSLIHCPNHINKNILYARILTPRSNYKHSETNQLVYDFKIYPQKKNLLDLKEKAIKKFTEELIPLFEKSAKSHITLIPIPTSKSKQDPAYDNRLERVCQNLENKLSKVHFIPLFERRESIQASHSTHRQRNLEELYQSLIVNESLVKRIEPHSELILLDDVITSGAHFEVCRRLLHQLFPKQSITGVFWAKARAR